MFKMDSWNYAGCVAGKDGAIGRDEQELASPAADAGFRKFRVVIRDNEDNARFAFQAFFGFLEFGDTKFKLAARGQERLAIRQAPAVILHAGEFYAAGPVLVDEQDHLLEFLNVLAVDDEVQGYADAVFLEPFENA